MTNGMILTHSGRDLLAYALGGNELRFTRAMTGDGVLADNINPYELTDLISPKQYLEIQSISTSKTGTAEVVVTMTNKDLETGYFVREYGLFARGQDGKTEILYAYANKGDKCSYLEGNNGVDLINYALSLVTVIDQAPNITAIINNENAYITTTKLDAKFANLYAQGATPAGFWAFAPEGDKRIRPLDLYETRRAILGTHDIASLVSHVERLEDNVAQILLAEEMNELYPEYSHYIIEDFKKVNQVDTFTAKITSIITGDDSIDCTPIKGMLPGSWYTITDGINSEVVQIESINLENNIQRVILTKPVKNYYFLKFARLYRTSANIISDAGQYVTGTAAKSALSWMPAFTWKGQGEKSYFNVRLNLDISNALSITHIKNATIDPEGFLKLLRNDYNIDAGDNSLSGLLVSDDFAIDCSDATDITAFNITGNIPSNCSVYFLFNLSNNWIRLGDNGEPENIFVGELPPFDLMLQSGNTITQLQSLHTAKILAGQRFGVAILLRSEDPFNATPKIKFSVDCITDTQILRTEKLSPVYALNNSQIAVISAPTLNSGSGDVAIFAQYTDLEDNLSEWLAPEKITGLFAKSIQFKAVYSIADIDGSTAQLNAVNLVFVTKRALITGSTSSELISLTENWYINLHECRLAIRHATLNFAKISAFIALRKQPVKVQSEMLGIGTGSRQTFALQNNNGVRYDSVRIFFDNKEIYSDFDVNTQVGNVSCNAPEGVVISCDYEYGWEKEIWREMEISKTLSENFYDLTEFKFFTRDENLSVCAIKISFDMAAGHENGEYIGKGTGALTAYELPRYCTGDLVITADNEILPPENFRLHEDAKIISISAPLNSILRASYNWLSETPEIYQFAAVFAK